MASPTQFSAANRSHMNTPMLSPLGAATAPSRLAASDRLTKVKQSLNNLSTTLRENIDNRKEQEDTRIAEVADMVTRLEKHLMLEIKRRTEADKALQAQFEQQVQSIAERAEQAHTGTIRSLQTTVELLTKRLLVLEKDLQEEREHTQRMAVELRHAATNSVVDVRAAIEQEKVNRQASEAQILRKISEDVYRVQEQSEVERKSREASVSLVREEMVKLHKGSERDQEKFKSKVLDDLECLKASIRIETEARESGEEQLAQAMDTVVQQVQESLKAVVR